MSEELAYYRAVEDHFCRLRGTPFLFSPKDFAYLRRWWQEGIPLSAVLLALGEVFAKKRERGEGPVSSLAYCRHAVARYAKRLAQARVGGEEPRPWDVDKALADLCAQLERVRSQLASPRLGQVVSGLMATIQALPRDVPAAVLADMLAELEEQALSEAWAALPEEEREELVRQLKAELPAGAELSGRAWQVVLWRAVREHLGFPRLELVPNGT